MCKSVQDREQKRECWKMDLRGVLDQFPPVEAAFAYGSGVFKQPKLYDANSQDKPMLDFVFVVEHAHDWHLEVRNQRTNGTCHAILLPPLLYLTGVANTESLQVEGIANKVGVGVHFNTLVPWKYQSIKYGVVSLSSLNHDLCSWDHLYLSGRLHKPVLWLKDSLRLRDSVQQNLKAALAASLLLLPQGCSELELLQMVCNLSYLGDIRMGLAEDPLKVRRIAEGSRTELLDLYKPQLKELSQKWFDGSTLLNEKPWTEIIPSSRKLDLLNFLPQAITNDVLQGKDPEEMLANSAYRKSLTACLARRVATSSRRQAIAGLLGVGAGKSFTYLLRKLKKTWPKFW